ncbi:MAG TPA: thiamine pyrophosphate-dependent enzyme [Fimbriimonadaceae bacterium]|nr:thiamine pyrophosphate-dependent enzyme [Fimbriimonadaceae bacterium]
MSVIPAKKSFNKLDYLKLMMLSREGDRREGILLRQSKGWFQVSGMGHEALGAFCYSLEADDYIFPYYRDRGIMLARGLSNYDLALAYFAKRASSSGGRQMPGHYSSREHNVFSVCTPTGGSLIPACGAAWAMKLSGRHDVALASVGDAASRQGEFYEAIAFAQQEKLPVIFVVEDNKFGISTPTDKFLPFNIGTINPEIIVKIDGRYPEVVLKAGQEAVEKARSGGGPTLFWADLDRLSSHTSSDDHRVYRKIEDIEEMAHRDPIRLLSEELIAAGELTAEEFTRLQEEIAQQVDEDYLRAEKQQDPRAEETLSFSFGDVIPAEAPPIQTGRQTMVSAINQVFKKALEDDPNVIFFGEDIEDPKGGVFGLTKGLSEAFPKQVYNSPLAEATIMGTAVGMGSWGMKPVFELQFIDFMAPGWNQITANMSTLRWRTFGNWKCPCVIYAPYGAYLPGGSLWHSQANEAYVAHTPGIKVAIPSTPEDAAGLFWTAIKGDDPHFILIPKHIFRMQVDVSKVEPVPFGKARIVQEGSDVTLVTWGNTIEIAQQAAAQLEGEASVEIVDIRSIVPCDYETITKSVEKTGRLVVVHEDNRTGGFGQTIIAEMTRVPERWNLFLSPPQLVAREDVHIGYNPIYEYAALPDLQQVIEAIRVTME